MGKSKDSSSNTKEEMERSGSEAIDTVEMISIIKEGESNEITTNSIGLGDASGLNIVSKDAVRTSHTDQFPPHLLMVCHTLTNMPRVDFTKIISYRSISHVEHEGDKLELGRGLSQECGKLDMLEMFKQRGQTSSAARGAESHSVP